MAESMSVDRGYFVSNLDKKRDREESMQTFQRIKRSHNVDMYFFCHYILSPTEMFYPADFHLNPPKIDQYLKLNLDGKKKYILGHADKIKTLVNLKQWDVIEKHAIELGEIVSTDPRLIDELDGVLLQLLVEFLSHKENLKLQSQAVIILQHYVSYTDSENRKLVTQKITSSIIADLMSSEDCELKMQALCLFRTMAPTMPESEFIAALDVVLETSTLLINGSTVDKDVLCGVSMTLAIVCQVYPKLPLPKLELVLGALKKLIECESSYIRTYACLGVVYLCDGREGIVFDRIYLGHFVDRLIEIINMLYRPKYRAGTVVALTALGTIMRWCSDDDIEILDVPVPESWRHSLPDSAQAPSTNLLLSVLFKVIIQGNDILQLLKSLLSIQDKQFVGNACWIISNVTAGKENHIKAVIDSGLIALLFPVVQDYKLLDVKKEAAWAISNAMYGVGSEQMEAFRNSCIEPLWNILEVSRSDPQIISFCLEGLVISEGVKVMYNGKPINASELKKHLVTLRGGQFQSELKKPRNDVGNKSFEDGVEFYVTRIVKDSARQPDLKIRLLYNSSEEDSSNMADQMEVDKPNENLYSMF